MSKKTRASAPTRRFYPSFDYETNWENDFPSGPQQIYFVTASRDGLSVRAKSNSLYNNWESVFEHLLEHKEELSWETLDCAYEEEEGETFDQVSAADTPECIREVFLSTPPEEACILVHKSDPFFGWLLSSGYMDDEQAWDFMD